MLQMITYLNLIKFRLSIMAATIALGLSALASGTRYNIAIMASEGGTVASNLSIANSGESVTLTVTPEIGYEIAEISGAQEAVSSCITPNSATVYTFVMPAHDITITVTFRQSSTRIEWEKAMVLIEQATFTLSKMEAPDADNVHYPLAALINKLLAETGFIVDPSDIEIYQIHIYNPTDSGATINPAIHRITTLQGTRLTPIQVAGITPLRRGCTHIEFRVTPPQAFQSAYGKAIITPSPFNLSANSSERSNSINGVQRVRGLTTDRGWIVYSLSGTQNNVPPYRGPFSPIWKAPEILPIPLPFRDKYIIVSDSKKLNLVW